MYPYEGMFLVDPVLHTGDPDGIEKTVSGLLEKHGARIHQFSRWDDRKLAYEIKGHKRGIYLLAHFEMPGGNVDALRKESRLTECILRQLVLRLEQPIPQYLEAVAAYHDKMRQDQDLRRPGRRDDEDGDGDIDMLDVDGDGDSDDSYRN